MRHSLTARRTPDAGGRRSRSACRSADERAQGSTRPPASSPARARRTEVRRAQGPARRRDRRASMTRPRRAPATARKGRTTGAVRPRRPERERPGRRAATADRDRDRRDDNRHVAHMDVEPGRAAARSPIRIRRSPSCSRSSSSSNPTARIGRERLPIPGRTLDRQRIDKWLWHARVVRTRTAAAALAGSGHVRLNGARIDAASRPVQPATW